MLPPSPDPAPRAAAFAAAALALVGTPFRHQGRAAGPGGGTDCGGVLVLAGQSCGYPVQDLAPGYRRRPTTAQVREALRASFDLLPPPGAGDEPQPGDILFFDVSADGAPCHVGVCVGGGRFVHSHAARFARAVAVAALDEHWRRAVAEVYRVRE